LDVRGAARHTPTALTENPMACNCYITIEGSIDKDTRLGFKPRTFENTRIPMRTQMRTAKDWIACREGHIRPLMEHSLECKQTTPGHVILAFWQHATRFGRPLSQTMRDALKRNARKYAPECLKLIPGLQ